MLDAKGRKKLWARRFGLKKDIQEKAAKVKIESTEKLPKYSTIESIAELEIQKDDVNKENELMKKERDIKLLLKIQNFLKQTKI